jgi:hypothetical protein
VSYPDLFKRAAMLWWRTRILWGLGVLAALVGYGDYQAGNVSTSFNVPAGDAEANPFPPELIEAWANNPALLALVENPAPFVIGLVAVLVLWLIIATLVGQLAHAAMIRVADVADQGYRATLGDGLRVGASRLLAMFALSLLVALPVILIVGASLALIVVLITQLVAASAAGSLDGPQAALAAIGGLLLCLIPLILVMGLLSLVLSFFVRIAQRACVIEGLGPVASLARAWRLVTRNFGLALLNWVALLMLGAIFGVLATLPALAIAIPAIFSFTSSGAVPWAALVGLVIYGFLVSVLLGGVLTSFNATLWTVLYRSFVAREG